MTNIIQSVSFADAFELLDANGDLVPGKVDVDFTKYISKGGGELATMSVTITESATLPGVYRFTWSAAHTDTAGKLKAWFKTTGSLWTWVEYYVRPAFDANVTQIGGDADLLDTMSRGLKTPVKCTVGAGGTTTFIPLSALDPTATSVDQFKDRYVFFEKDTATTGLRGVAKKIIASAVTPASLTVDALPVAPNTGDKLTIG